MDLSISHPEFFALFSANAENRLYPCMFPCAQKSLALKKAILTQF